MKKWLTGSFWLCFLCILHAQSTVKGRVTDPQGNPLPGANIVITETGQGTVTDSLGYFSFESLPTGRYAIQVSYTGYETAAQTFATNVRKTFIELNFTLRETAVQLETLTVKATRFGSDASFTRNTLNRAEIKAINLGRDLPYLLDATPGVVVNSDAGAGIGYTGVRIRGTDPSRINVTINGIPLNDAESQSVFWVNTPDLASSAQDIHIQRGVGTSSNGTGAFGATININTTSPSENPFARIEGSVGSFNTLRNTVSFGSGWLKNFQADGSVRRFSLDGRLSRITSDGYVDRAKSNLRAFFLTGVYAHKKSVLKAHVFSGHEITYQAWNGVPAQWIDDKILRTYNVSGTEKPGTPHDREVDDYNQTHYQLFYNRTLHTEWQLQAAGHYTRGYGYFEQYKADENPARYLLPAQHCPEPENCLSDYIRRRWLDNHFYGGMTSLHFRHESHRMSAVFSAAWNHYLGDHFGEIIWGEYLAGAIPGHRYYFGKGNKQDFNFFFKSHYRIIPGCKAFVDLQWRRVVYDINGTDNDLRETSVSKTWNFFNPKAGISYDFSHRFKSYASFAVAHREPTRSDFTDAPPGIRPVHEQLFNTEAGIRYHDALNYLGITFYRMFYRNQLVPTGNINDVGAPIRSNVAKSLRTGIEVEARYQLTRLLNIEGNVAFSRNIIRNFTEFVDNWDTGEQEVFSRGTTELAFSPRTVAFARFNFEAMKAKDQAMTISISGKMVGRQFIDNTSNPNTVLAPYTVMDGQLRWIITPNFAREISVNVMIINLLNKRYAANAWTYRYISASYDARPDNPYAQLEGENVYNLTGFFPQAGRHFIAGFSLQF